MALVGAEFQDRLDFYMNAWLPARDVVQKAVQSRYQVKSQTLQAAVRLFMSPFTVLRTENTHMGKCIYILSFFVTGLFSCAGGPEWRDCVAGSGWVSMEGASVCFGERDKDGCAHQVCSVPGSERPMESPVRSCWIQHLSEQVHRAM